MGSGRGKMPVWGMRRTRVMPRRKMKKNNIMNIQTFKPTARGVYKNRSCDSCFYQRGMEVEIMQSLSYNYLLEWHSPRKIWLV
jgi:hypothetical protein